MIFLYFHILQYFTTKFQNQSAYTNKYSYLFYLCYNHSFNDTYELPFYVSSTTPISTSVAMSCRSNRHQRLWKKKQRYATKKQRMTYKCSSLCDEINIILNK